jgi:Na+/H+ antiporter NhaC
LRKGAVPLRSTKEVKLPVGVEHKAKTVVIPLAIVLIVMFTVFFLNDFPKESLSGIVIRQGIALGFILGGIATTFISVKNKIFTLEEAETAVFNGMKDMVYLMVLMTFAWSLGSACKQLGTAYYIMEVAEGFLNPAYLPAILFIVGAIMSLSTGSRGAICYFNANRIAHSYGNGSSVICDSSCNY